MRVAAGTFAALAAVALMTGNAAHAIDPDSSTFDDPVAQARYERLTDELRCLVCQNQTIADSDADLAKDLRAQVRRMMADGASDEQILAYMSDRYGDFVRYRPPWSPKTWLLWLGPALALGISVLFVVGLVRRLKRADDAGESSADNLDSDRS